MADRTGGQELNIYAICGSMRAKSFNRALLSALSELAPEGMRITAAPRLSLPIYDDDERAVGNVPDLAHELADGIRAADGVVLVSPEYNHSVAAPLKNAIDWMSKLDDQPFAGQVFALQSAATGLLGGSRAQYHLRQVLNSVGGMTMGKPEVFVTQCASKFDEGLRLTDEATRKMIRTQLSTFAGFIASHGPASA